MATPLYLAQQVFSALNIKSDDPRCANSTVFNATSGSPQNFPAIPTDISSLIGFLLSFSALGNWLKLVLFGSVLEALRRLGLHFYYKIYNSFFITAHFDEGDASYDWMMVWLSNQPSWKSARDVQISTRSFGLNSNAVMIEGEPEDASAVLSGNRPLAYLPSIETSHSFWYKRHWIRVSRSTKEGYYGRREDILDICIFTLNHRILNTLLLEAKKVYQAAQENMISVYVSDTSNNWRHIASRPKRPLTSIVLDPGIKDLLIDDARDFLESKRWYSARGIPFRRGYLLYGAPGSGKTSIIHSLAGELGLDVYVISLSRVGLDDTSLSELISELPEKCIALMEDIDAAFSQTVNRDGDEEEEEEEESGPTRKRNSRKQQNVSSTSRISLSGLLNALDGVGAQEGRILFATTNKYTSLDAALCRPGRMDIHIEFKLASKYQANELYRCFYLPDSENEVPSKVDKAAEKDEDISTDDSGYSSSNEKDDVEPSSPASEASSVSPVHESVNFSGYSHRTRAPKLSARRIKSLAAAFAAVIPEREFSMATLQGYLMTYKTRPIDAIKDAPAWVEKEHAESEKKASASSEVHGPPSAPIDSGVTKEPGQIVEIVDAKDSI